MPIKTRRIILGILILIFLILSPILILYANGWRIDFKTFSINKTGAIYFKILDSDIQIRINNKIIDSYKKSLTGFLFDNLPTKSYKIEIIKDGYQKWTKNLEVLPSRITETKKIVLVPDIKNAIIVKSEVINFKVFNNQLIWQDKNNDFLLTNLNDLDSAINLTLLFNHLKQTQLKFPGYVPIAEIIPQNENKNHFIIKTAKAAYYLDIRELKLQLTDLGKVFSTPEISPLYSPDKDKIAFPVEDGLIVIDKAEPMKFDINTQMPIREIFWYKDSEHLFIQCPEKLYFLEIDQRLPLNLQLISDNIKKYAYNPENDRLYFLIGEELKYLEF